MKHTHSLHAATQPLKPRPRQVCVVKSRCFRNRDDCPSPPMGITLGMDERWERLRSLLNPYFFSRQNLARHVSDVAGKAGALVDAWERRGGEVELSSECTALSQVMGSPTP